MSRALLLKRHIVDAESSRLSDYAEAKPPPPPPPHLYYPLAKSASEPIRLYGDAIYALNAIYAEPLSLVAPLDLSLKSNPAATAAPITPPSTPSPLSLRKAKPEESPRTTPKHHQQRAKGAAAGAVATAAAKLKKQKANRKLNFDEDKSSPVSGTIIRDRSELAGHHVMVQKGDIDPMYNVVEVTEEAKAELAKIENRIGDYLCKLCREMYKDAFSLAQHRCSCIIHVEYKCPECEKVFNCPANLASHRRWHKPKMATTTATAAAAAATSTAPPKSVPAAVDLQTRSSYSSSSERAMDTMYDSSSRGDDDSECEDGDLHIPCPLCGKLFRKQSYLRGHLAQHHISEIQHSIWPQYGIHHIAAN